MLEPRQIAVRLSCVVALALALSGGPRAERLPIRQYGIVDGMATDAVGSVYHDSRGFLWFCTHAGLSRFDGHGFVNYGVEHGLSVDIVVDIAETPSGDYWIATWGGDGIARFDPREKRSAPLFVPVPLPDERARRVVSLHVDRSGRLWVGTVSGLFVREPSAAHDAAFRLVSLNDAVGPPGRPRIWDLVDDRDGNLWVATPEGLFRLTPDGRLFERPLIPGPATPVVRAVIEDRDGRIWAGHDEGLTVFRPQSLETVRRDAAGAVSFPADCHPRTGGGELRLPETPGATCWYRAEDGLGPGLVTALFETPRGQVWISRFHQGLTEFDGHSFRTFGDVEGFGGYIATSFAEDSSGNLWVGTLDSGALRIARSGFTAYDRADGLGYTRHARITESMDEEIVVTAGAALYVFDEARFRVMHPRVLEGLDSGSSADMSILLQDHAAEWWFGTPRGLYRFGATESIRHLVGAEPIEQFTAENGLPGEVISSLFEDSAGDIWIGCDAPDPIVRWERATGALHRYPGAQGPRASNEPLGFAEDHAGQVWVGLARGLTRFRDGRFTHFTADDGLVADGVIQPHVDRSGRLWLASARSGVTRVDDPTVERPSFAKRYTVDDGLASNPVLCAVDDLFGRLYFCTAKGVDRLDPESGHIRHYTRADGLSTSEIVGGRRDRGGALWFTSQRGVSRLVPRADPRVPARPPVRVTRLRVAGVPVPVSELGETGISGLRLPAARNHVEIEFASLSFEVGEEIRYDYRLGGAADDWSLPTAAQSINFANLSPGRYAFEVRAVNSYGAVSESPATVSFRILPPFWRRWWFLTLAVAALAGLAVGVHRLRVARVLELEKVRTRIATDLHDDIGASLSQIAILSEVLDRRKDLEGSTSRTYLARIADSSRELVDSMADIVWAINPKRDRLSDLVQRMRRFMGDAVAGREIEYGFSGPPEGRELRLGPDVRRQLFLVFKESVNNAVRHSGCGRVDVRLGLDDSTLRLEVADDGQGFDAGREYDGNGLDSMRRRARELGGSLGLDSRPGEGTTVRLEVSMARRNRLGKGPVSPE